MPLSAACTMHVGLFGGVAKHLILCRAWMCRYDRATAAILNHSRIRVGVNSYLAVLPPRNGPNLILLSSVEPEN